jgi:hypothetical protein
MSLPDSAGGDETKSCVITLLQEADAHRIGLFLLIVHG